MRSISMFFATLLVAASTALASAADFPTIHMVASCTTKLAAYDVARKAFNNAIRVKGTPPAPIRVKGCIGGAGTTIGEILPEETYASFDAVETAENSYRSVTITNLEGYKGEFQVWYLESAIPALWLGQ